MALNTVPPDRHGRPSPPTLPLPVGCEVTIDHRPFVVSRTREGRIVLFARDGSRAWLDDEDVAKLVRTHRLQVVGRVALRAALPARADRRGAWARR